MTYHDWLRFHREGGCTARDVGWQAQQAHDGCVFEDMQSIYKYDTGQAVDALVNGVI
jgi:hypothetical protein